MTDIVKRLRSRREYLYDHSGCGKPDRILLTEAADEIEQLRAQTHQDRIMAMDLRDRIERLHQACDGYLGELAAMRANKDDEIERLRGELAAMRANKDDEIERLEAELKKIAFPPEDIDVPHYPVSIARAALTLHSKSESADHNKE